MRILTPMNIAMTIVDARYEKNESIPELVVKFCGCWTSFPRRVDSSRHTASTRVDELCPPRCSSITLHCSQTDTLDNWRSNQAVFTLRRLRTTVGRPVWSRAHTRCYVVVGFCELAVRRLPVFKALNEQEASSVSAADAEEGLARPHHLRRLVNADAIRGEMASIS